MKENKFLKLSLEEWSNLEEKIYEVKSTYFLRFYEAIEKRFQNLKKEKLLVNLWSLNHYNSGIGATYNPKFYWSLNNSMNSICLEFEVGRGLAIKSRYFSKHTISTENLQKLKEIFIIEDGWWNDLEGILSNRSIFDLEVYGGEKPSIKEVWKLGNETEKYADLLIDFVSKYFENEELIKLFLKISTEISSD